MEDEVDSGASKTLGGDLPDKVAVQFLVVLLDESSDQMQDDWSHILLVDSLKIHVVGCQLTLLLLYGERDLLRQVGHAHLNVPYQMPVEGLSEERDTHLR